MSQPHDLAVPLTVASIRPGLSGKRVRAWALQGAVVLAVLVVLVLMARNASDNLRSRGLAAGFGFLSREAGFDIGFKLISYEQVNSYGRAFVVALLNTIFASLCTIVLSTLLGFLIGVVRISPNWLFKNLAKAYVELIRNIPLLIHILFWYNVGLRALPQAGEGWSLAGLFLNNRGLFVPSADIGPNAVPALLLCLALAGALVVAIRQALVALGRQTFGHAGLAACWIVVAAALLPVFGPTVAWDHPSASFFGVRGGATVPPEFLALWVGLSLYTAAFIAEIVRAGLQGVDRGQYEAAQALGLRRSQALRLVLVPQALRIIVPPLANQYQSVFRNSSLAAAIGFPELFSVFAGTVLNQSGQAIEVMAITLAVYLAISLAVAGAMNLYNRRVGFSAPGGAGRSLGQADRPRPATLRAWLHQNLLSSPANVGLTGAAALLLLVTVPPFIEWALVDATWFGTSRADCGATGACWAFVTSRLGQFVYGFYPPGERWRVDVLFASVSLLISCLVLPRFPAKRGIALASVIVFPVLVVGLLYGGIPGLPIVPTEEWGGLLLTLVVGFTAISLSLPIGIALALGRRSRLPVVQGFSIAVIEFWRGVPLLAVLFLSTIMLPFFLPANVGFNKLVWALGGMSLYTGALMAEVLRGGLQAIPAGQFEAARALGLRYVPTHVRIILPQALRISLPAIVNTAIGIFKDTTLVLIVGLFDLLAIVVAGLSDPRWIGVAAEAYVFVGAVFWIFCFGFSKYSQRLERWGASR